MHAKYGQNYHWFHKDYCGHAILDTYIETHNTDICVIHHRLEKEWYSLAAQESCLHTITIATGVIDDDIKVVRLRPSTVIDLQASLPYYKNHKNDVLTQLGYTVETDEFLDKNIQLALKCMKNAKMSKRMIDNVLRKL